MGGGGGWGILYFLFIIMSYNPKYRPESGYRHWICSKKLFLVAFNTALPSYNFSRQGFCFGFFDAYGLVQSLGSGLMGGTFRGCLWTSPPPSPAGWGGTEHVIRDTLDLGKRSYNARKSNCT